MKFKGTIIITDPCYVIKKNNYPSPKPADFNLPESIDRKPVRNILQSITKRMTGQDAIVDIIWRF